MGHCAFTLGIMDYLEVYPGLFRNMAILWVFNITGTNVTTILVSFPTMRYRLLCGVGRIVGNGSVYVNRQNSV